MMNTRPVTRLEFESATIVSITPNASTECSSIIRLTQCVLGDNDF